MKNLEFDQKTIQLLVFPKPHWWYVFSSTWMPCWGWSWFGRNAKVHKILYIYCLQTMVWIWGNKSNHIFEIEPTFLSNEADTIFFFEEKNNNIFITKHISKSFVLLIYLCAFWANVHLAYILKGYELRKLDRLDCPATNCKNSTTTYTTTIAN